MTLWRRTADGIALCAIAIGLLIVSATLLRSGVPALEGLGGFLGVMAYAFSFPMLAFGGVLIVGGGVGHLLMIWKRQKTDA